MHHSRRLHGCFPVQELDDNWLSNGRISLALQALPKPPKLAAEGASPDPKAARAAARPAAKLAAKPQQVSCSLLAHDTRPQLHELPRRT